MITDTLAAMEQFTDINTEELHIKSKQIPDLLLVDLRDRHKFTNEHIKGAVSFPMRPTLLEKLFKKRALKKILGPNYNRSITFY